MLPESFLERMRRMLGAEYGAFLESFEKERCQALRLNVMKKRADGKNAGEVFGAGKVSFFAHLTRVPWAENGYYYQGSDQPGKHPFHQAGLYYIQEPSAMVPAALLDARPGERVLDLCAAPGGKSTQIGAALQGKGFLLCNEIHPARAKILSENIERMGICNACVTNETPAHLAEFFPEYFDKILVDAPCSGEGMFRKNESACEEWSLENVALCADRQDEILDYAAKMLRPGGRLVYSTCTFAPEENEGSISRFLQRHGEFRILPVEKERLGLKGCDGVPELGGGMEELRNTLRLWPHRMEGEGHFAAVLQKRGELPEGVRSMPVNGTVKGISEKELGEFASFCVENVKFFDSPVTDRKSGQQGEFSEKNFTLAGLGGAVGMSGGTQYIRFGDNLYLVPQDMPSLKGLKVLRPGLHLGELKKNRFEPSHAFALALTPQNAVHIWPLHSDEPTVQTYLNGQTFTGEGEKGWYLICVDGFSLGWGKLAGGIMKNHYPRGLRI